MTNSKFDYIMRSLLFMGVALVSFNACKKDGDDPSDIQDPDNEPENITTVRLEIVNDGQTTQATWTDPDGPGGNDPSVDSVILDTNATYQLLVSFLDASGETVEDLTSDIAEEDEEHVVCFETSMGLSVERTDSDGTYTVGLINSLTTVQGEEGSLRLILKHQPNGLKDGTCTPGETDVEVDFPVKVE